MPVVQVFAPEAGDVAALLAELADGVAHALGLGGGDVIATFVPVSATVASGGGPGAGSDSWPIVAFHGSRRGGDLEAGAVAAAEAAVRSWAREAGIPTGGVWTEWVEPGLGA
ncbi:hypothetical protein [Antiquaquibacter soli]|uniref:Uncharacterized protein n=1 Tax=Antiquaquibacter soli TaxID=3064523 RepID=A0ABT9BUL5_9MICO|nr:hypothetical protein [Protaetiibacter sp. WY-16]MDO7883032.1 hypothetical protein [Protaetiibacter sp. WY-16]